MKQLAQANERLQSQSQQARRSGAAAATPPPTTTPSAELTAAKATVMRQAEEGRAKDREIAELKLRLAPPTRAPGTSSSSGGGPRGGGNSGHGGSGGGGGGDGGASGAWTLAGFLDSLNLSETIATALRDGAQAGAAQGAGRSQSDLDFVRSLAGRLGTPESGRTALISLCARHVPAPRARPCSSPPRHRHARAFAHHHTHHAHVHARVTGVWHVDAHVHVWSRMRERTG